MDACVGTEADSLVEVDQFETHCMGDMGNCQELLERNQTRTNVVVELCLLMLHI